MALSLRTALPDEGLRVESGNNKNTAQSGGVFICGLKVT